MIKSGRCGRRWHKSFLAREGIDYAYVVEGAQHSRTMTARFRYSTAESDKQKRNVGD